jgi:uncharacterized protein (TIGR03000 family)
MFHIGGWVLRSAAIAAALLVGTAAPVWAGGGGGHGGGGGGHGGGGMHAGGGGMHAGGGGYYHGGGGYYHGGGYYNHGGYYNRGYYGGYGGLYIGLYPGYGGGYYGGGYGYSYPSVSSYYAPDYAPPLNYYSGPSGYPQAQNYPNYPPPENVPPPSPPPQNGALVEVSVPPNAEVWFDGNATRQTGEHRIYSSPSLDPDKVFHYEIRARWIEGDKIVDQKRTIEVRAGRRTAVDFTKPQ